MIVLKPHDVLTFGKNKGVRLSEIYKYQPSYIEWAIKNVDDFKIDIAEFEKLPKPTPIGYNSNAMLSRPLINIETASTDELMDLLAKTDGFNWLKSVNVSKVKELIEKDGFVAEEIIYSFPEEIRFINDHK